MRKRLFLFLLLACFGAGQFSQVNSQEATQEIFEVTKANLDPDTPVFALQMFNFAADSLELSKLLVQLNFPFSNIQFIRNRETDDEQKKFRADVQATLTISDSSSEEVASIKWKSEVYAQDYKETKLEDKYGFTRNSVDLKPGKYNFKIELKDLETQRSCDMQGTVKLTDYFSQKFAISDLLFVNSMDFLKGAPSEKNEDAFYVYYEIYNIPQNDTARMRYKIELANGQIQDSGVETFQSQGQITKKYFPISRETFSTNFQVDITVYYNGDSLSVLKQLYPSSKSQGPIYENLDESIEQLTYIADKKEIVRMKKLQEEEKLNAFNEFWKKKDPTPETAVNEYFNEYYRRIRIANERFEGVLPGWRTQMGMVFIKLGPPTYVNQPYNDTYVNPIYGRRKRVVWIYNMLNRRVIFELLGADYRISNYHEIFDLLSDDDIRLRP